MGSERWGSYLLEEQIATGGMGEVFRARRIGAAAFSRQVCIKRMHVHYSRDPVFLSLFLDEARTGSKLRHRNIVSIEDLGEHDGQYFLAMEYVNGVDLSKVEERLLSDGQVMPADAGLFIAHELLSGLHAAHTAVDPDDGHPLNVVHRDVSPHNTLVSFAGEVKLTDFGIAKAERRLHKTQGSVVRGRFGYMPIEQASSTDLDARADLYALGVTLFEMFAGKRPFCGDNPDAGIEQIIAAQLTNDRPILESLRPDLPSPLLRLIESMLSAAAFDRPPSAAVALDVLRKIPSIASGGHSLASLMGQLFPSKASVASVPRLEIPLPRSPVRNDNALAASARSMTPSSGVSAPVDPLGKTVSAVEATTPPVPIPGSIAPTRAESATSEPTRAATVSPASTATYATSKASPTERAAGTPEWVVGLVVAAVGMVTTTTVVWWSRRGSSTHTARPSATDERPVNSSTAKLAIPDTRVISPAPTNQPTSAIAAAPIPSNAPQVPSTPPSAQTVDAPTNAARATSITTTRSTNTFAPAGAQESPARPDATHDHAGHHTAPLPIVATPHVAAQTPAAIATHPSETEPVASAASEGVLRIVVTPWGEISIDGQRRGRDHVQVTLPAGPHDIRVTGGVERHATIVVHAGRNNILRIQGDEQ